MTPTDLTGTERAVLIVLMAESRPVANPELAALGPALYKPGRDKLNALGLLESERRGSWMHYRVVPDALDAVAAIVAPLTAQATA